ncbi:hypothetical protein [Candidatus Galacturonibacter soehngenii]|uniref:Tail fiber domain-containing protein n=1 Tax=Candidatus Galacturonatibacter soehngenii TaxID=2307010 RepID=A0A7V7QJ05_9FIRM|nr:hypothetical protein [Candidatus Galacturonibacter soehngenii]KAB1437543.1 hypothetical protein F7O84_08010 [Candidatus Galacturonibacter soehngenii]
METTNNGVITALCQDIYNVQPFNSNATVLDNHINTVASDVKLGHIKIGTGFDMIDELVNVKIADNLSTDDSDTALSAKMGKELNESKASKNHASTEMTYGIGSDTSFGHVKLSDDYTSSSGAAMAGVGASSKAVCDAYNELNTNLDNLKSDVNTLKGKFGSQQIGIKSFRYLNFSGIFSCIITIDGVNGQSYGSFIANGYGIGSNRMHVAKLQAGSPVTCTILEDREAIYVSNQSGSESTISIFMLYGALPEFTTS